MKNAVIILPVHKLFHNLTKNEIHSLRQLDHVLGDSPLCIIAANNFPVNEYIRFFKNENILVEQFKEESFKTIRSYNKLCLSKDFYKRFFHYDYMLVYQSDAYVFKNDLEYWVQQDYDYIGAPFYKNNREPFDMKLWSVGNGGFSLRSIKKCYQLLSRIKFYYSSIKLLDKLGCKKFITKSLIKLGFINLAIIERIILNKYNEDYVFGVLSRQIIGNFIVAPLEVAWKFSFEAHPGHLYKLNNKQLPFGCHGWDKYEPEFWKNFINASSQVLES